MHAVSAPRPGLSRAAPSACAEAPASGSARGGTPPAAGEGGSSFLAPVQPAPPPAAPVVLARFEGFARVDVVVVAPGGTTEGAPRWSLTPPPGGGGGAKTEASPHGDCVAYMCTRTPARRRTGGAPGEDGGGSIHSNTPTGGEEEEDGGGAAAASGASSLVTSRARRWSSRWKKRTSARLATISACVSASASPRAHRECAGRHFVPVPRATTRGGAEGSRSSVSAKPARRVYSPAWGLPFFGSDAYRRSTAAATAAATGSDAAIAPRRARAERESKTTKSAIARY